MHACVDSGKVHDNKKVRMVLNSIRLFPVVAICLALEEKERSDHDRNSWGQMAGGNNEEETSLK